MTVEIPPAGTYEVDIARSEIRFTVRHRFGTGTVHGSVRLTGGAITVAEPASRSSVSASADASSFQSGNTGRDTKVRSATFLDATRYPGMSFESRTVETTSEGRWRLHGVLDAHGVASDASFELTESRSSGNSIDITALGVVDRYAHGVTAMKGMAGRHLQLTIVLHGERSAQG